MTVVESRPTGPRRVMLVSADMGGGHESTATALERAAEQLWPGVETSRMDTLDAMGPGVGSLFRRIYVGNVERTPWLYEFFYANLWRQQWFARASKRFTGSWSGRRLHTAIDRFDPDLVLSTYPLGSAGLAWLRRHRGLAVPTAAYVSDFAPHPFWIHRDVDLNFVVHDVALPSARACDPGAVVDVCAPPAQPGFTPGERATARAVHGLLPDAFLVLVSCGSYAFGDVVSTVETLLQASPSVQVVATCGRNASTLRRLQALGLPEDRLRPLGWTADMPDLVRAADVVLSNAGGAISSEAMACGRPVLMYRPIAAHGRANAELMVVSGLADLCTDEDQLQAYIRSAVEDRTPLHELEGRAKRHTESHDLAAGLLRLAATGKVLAPSRPRETRWRMRPSDAFFVHAETGHVRQEVGAVLELDEASGQRVTLAAAREQIGQRIERLPPLRRRLVRGRTPAWAPAGSVDVRRHVTETVVPALDEAVAEAVDGFWSESLPEDRPAWAITLVRSEPQGRSVLAVKMHHALGDGISALGLLDRLLDAAPDDPLRERRPARVAHPRPRSAREAGRQAMRVSARAATGLFSLACRRRPPRHGLNRPVGTSRVTVARVSVDAQRLHRLARSSSARAHEVILTIAADAIARALTTEGLVNPAKPLRVMVPVAMRIPRLDRVFGNWTGSIALDLPMAPVSFPERLALVQAELARRSARGEPVAAQLVMQVMGHLPSRWHAAAARLVYTNRFFSSIVSYMPAARNERWFAGARVRAVYPVVPLAPGVPLTVGVVLSGQTAGFGFLFDAALPVDRTALAGAVDAAVTAAEQEVG